MKCAGQVLNTKIDETGRMLAKIQLNGKLPQIGENITCSWGAKRSLEQNGLYWVFLTWLVNEGGLKEHGHYSQQALHINLKDYFISEKKMDKGQFKVIEEGTTTDMSKLAFAEYFDKINAHMIDFFEISTAPFWQDYKDFYGKY